MIERKNTTECRL